MRIQLLTFPDCPNSTATRQLIQRVLDSTNVHAEIEDVDTAAPETPDNLRGWGSPTILIDGADVEGQSGSGNMSCRLYRDSSGRYAGIPTESALRVAIERARSR